MISAKNLYRPYFALIGFSLLIFLLAGCVGGTSSPSTFYLLHPMEQEQVPNTELKKSKPISILIGPIAVPAYLDRPQVVTLTSGNRLVLNEFNRWAEPLRDNFYRVLAENLFLLMDTNDIFTYERRGLIPSGIQVVIDVNRFDFTQGKNARLDVFWTLVDTESNTSVLQKKSSYEADAAAQDIAGIVAALNQTLSDFSRDIANALHDL